VSSAPPVSSYVIEKALRLVEDGRVELRGAHHAFVQGDTGRYLVRVFDDGVECDCPNRHAFCAHSLAAMVVWAEARGES